MIPARLLRRLLLGLAGMLLLVVVLGAATLLVSSQSGSRWLLERVAAAVNRSPGVAISLGETSGTFLRGLAVKQVSFTGAGGLWQVQRLRTEWNPFSLLTGDLVIGQVELAGFSVQLQAVAAAAAPTLRPLQFAPVPLAITLDQLRIDGLELQQDSRRYVFDQVTASARLAGTMLTLSGVQLQSGVLEVAGEMGLSLADYLPLEADLQWQYRGDRLLALSEQWNVAAGRLQVTGDLRSLRLTSELAQPLSLRSQGSVETGLDQVGASLRFDLLHEAGTLELPWTGLAGTSFTGPQLRTTGTPADLQWQLQAGVSRGQLPPVQLSINASITAGRLQVDELAAVSTGGTLAASGQLMLAAPWSAEVGWQLREFAAADWLPPNLPVQLRNVLANGSLTLAWPDARPQGRLQLDSLRGELGQYEVSGSGAVAWDDGTVQFEDLSLASSGSRLDLAGGVAEQLDLSWTLAVADLRQIIDGASGALAMTGSLGGTPQAPALSLQGQLREFAFDQYELALVELNGSGSDGNYQLDLLARELLWGSGAAAGTAERLGMRIMGNRDRHQIRASGSSTLGSADLVLLGGFIAEGWGDWDGRLEQLSLTGDYGDWQLVQPAALQVREAGIVTDDLCLTLGSARLCARAESGTTGEISGSVSLQGFPLSAFNPVSQDNPALLPAIPKLPTLAGLDGELSLDATLAYAGGNLDTTVAARTRDAVLSITPPLASDADAAIATPSPQFYAIDSLVLNGDRRAGEWRLGAALDFSRRDIDDTALTLAGNADAELQISDAADLTGSINFDMGDLGWIAAMVPELANVTGRLQGNAAFGGNLQAPRLTRMDLEILDGGAAVLPLGVDFSEVMLRLLAFDDQNLQLSGSLRSDQGRLGFTGDIARPYSGQRSLVLGVTGEDFLLLQRDDLMLRIAPAITVIADREGIDLSGRLHLPALALTLAGLPENAVDVSRDTVVVAYPPERPDLARSIAAEESTLFDLPVSTDLQITLGEQVRFSGFGLDARLEGELSIDQGDNGASLTYGELSISEGSYSAYGTRLQLEQGKLLFFGAYDNPALDIRAVRRVEELTAGLQINGTLKNINSQLYSTPALPENDIIAVLITGKPFAEIGEQDSLMLLNAVAGLGLERSEGLTSQIRDRLGLDTLGVETTGDINNSILTIGKYLSPTLFVRYGVGLFDRQSTVALDYKVTDTLTLQAESGEYQSVDLSYRIER